MNATRAAQRFFSALLFASGALLLGGVFIEGFLGSSSDEPLVYGVGGVVLIAGGVMLRRRTVALRETQQEDEPSSE